MIVPRDASHPSCTNVHPQGEYLWHARGAVFPVFKDSEPEVMTFDVTIEDYSLFIADELPATSQLPQALQMPPLVLIVAARLHGLRYAHQTLPLLTILDTTA